MLVLVDICRFTMISRDFGLAFGDVLLEQFSKMFLQVCEEGAASTPVMIRAGSDELLAWIPGEKEASCRQKLWKLKERFQGLVRQSLLKLEFKAGFAWGGEENNTDTLLHQVCVAVLEAEKKDAETLFWSEVEDTGQHRSNLERSYLWSISRRPVLCPWH